MPFLEDWSVFLRDMHAVTGKAARHHFTTETGISD
jgi:hypothetical protein